MPKEGWFILTNLFNLEVAIQADQKRFRIEEMFQDFKSGGYNLEQTQVTDERLNTLILLIAIAYTSTTIQGQNLKRIGVAKYVGRTQEPLGQTQRYSHFYLRL